MGIHRSFYFLISVSFFLHSFAFAQLPPKSESEFKKYFYSHDASLDTIEGLWNVSTIQEFYSFDTLYDTKTFNQTVAILKKDSIFRSYDMKGASFNVSFTKTEVNKVYLFKIYFRETDSYTKADAVIGAGRKLEYSYEFPEDYLQFMLRDTFEKGDRVVNKVVWTKIFP